MQAHHSVEKYYDTIKNLSYMELEYAVTHFEINKELMDCLQIKNPILFQFDTTFLYKYLTEKKLIYEKCQPISIEYYEIIAAVGLCSYDKGFFPFISKPNENLNENCILFPEYFRNKIKPMYRTKFNQEIEYEKIAISDVRKMSLMHVKRIVLRLEDNLLMASELLRMDIKKMVCLKEEKEKLDKKYSDFIESHGTLENLHKSLSEIEKS